MRLTSNLFSKNGLVLMSEWVERLKSNLPSANYSSSLVFSLSCQSSRLPCCRSGCSEDCNCSCLCVCQSEESEGLRLGWLMLENTTAPVTHVGLWGLTRLYLTPRARRALTALCVCHTHFVMGVAPPLTSEPSCFCCSRLLQLSGLHRQNRSDSSDD